MCVCIYALQSHFYCLLGWNGNVFHNSVVSTTELPTDMRQLHCRWVGKSGMGLLNVCVCICRNTPHPINAVHSFESPALELAACSVHASVSKHVGLFIGMCNAFPSLKFWLLCRYLSK